MFRGMNAVRMGVQRRHGVKKIYFLATYFSGGCSAEVLGVNLVKILAKV